LAVLEARTGRLKWNEILKEEPGDRNSSWNAAQDSLMTSTKISSPVTQLTDAMATSRISCELRTEERNQDLRQKLAVLADLLFNVSLKVKRIKPR
jgi:hypothetical protein